MPWLWSPSQVKLAPQGGGGRAAPVRPNCRRRSAGAPVDKCWGPKCMGGALPRAQSQLAGLPVQEPHNRPTHAVSRIPRHPVKRKLRGLLMPLLPEPPQHSSLSRRCQRKVLWKSEGKWVRPSKSHCLGTTNKETATRTLHAGEPRATGKAEGKLP